MDIFLASATDNPDALAVDSGVEVLTYAELAEAAEAFAARLAEAGVGRGQRVGVRIRSGTTELYVAILGVLFAGAAYVPVDADDPDERARLVFGEAQVRAVVGNDLAIAAAATPGRTVEPGSAATSSPPTPDDDAWIIFTSGSTGTPKGVAVTHRNAAAFVDAESQLFLQHPAEPIGPGDRVMAGLSVAFDASCEEIWLAWSNGACLVPAPRSLVRSGVDVGPWLVANDITVVSTVPTLVALWPPTALSQVRLLIMGGEACPAELASRLQAPGREVWNTYGPTEATVVACAALLDGTAPIRIGLPLAGWDLAVVDGGGAPVAAGESGELIISGVGLARYLDPAKDAEKYAPMPTLGWPRAYRSGDLVRNDPAGLIFLGRADDQIKLGGRRIELGEIDGELLRLPGVVGAAAAVRATASGNKVLIGYLTVDPSYDSAVALELLRSRMPAALVPRLAVVSDLPTRTSGKVDRDALPWPLPRSKPAATGLDERQSWIARIWHDVLGADVTSPTDDFFDFGGGSLTAAQVVGRLRERFPEVAVGDVYAHPTIAALAACLEELSGTVAKTDRRVKPIRPKTQAGQLAALLPLRGLRGLRWLTWLALGSRIAHDLLALAWVPTVSWWLIGPAVALLLLPPGRMLLAAGLIRFVLRGLTPGRYPRGGKVHLRIWLADRISDELAAVSVSGAPLLLWYARLLGARIGRDVQLHTVPPVTGLLQIGAGADVEPEADLVRLLDRRRCAARRRGPDPRRRPDRGAKHAGAGSRCRQRSRGRPRVVDPRVDPVRPDVVGIPGRTDLGVGPRPVVGPRPGPPTVAGPVRDRRPADRRATRAVGPGGPAGRAAGGPRRRIAGPGGGGGTPLAAGRRLGRLRDPGPARAWSGPAVRGRADRRPSPGPVMAGPEHLGDLPDPRRGPYLALSGLLCRLDPGLAAAAGRPDRTRRRSVDGAADPEVRPGQ